MLYELTVTRVAGNAVGGHHGGQRLCVSEHHVVTGNNVVIATGVNGGHTLSRAVGAVDGEYLSSLSFGSADSYVLLVDIVKRIGNDRTVTYCLYIISLEHRANVKYRAGSKVEGLVILHQIVKAVLGLIPAVDPDDVGIVFIGDPGGIRNIVGKDRENGILIIVHTDKEIVGLIHEHGNNTVTEACLKALCRRHYRVFSKVCLDLNIDAHTRAVKGKHGKSAVMVAAASASVAGGFLGVVIHRNFRALIPLSYGHVVCKIASYSLREFFVDLKHFSSPLRLF